MPPRLKDDVIALKLENFKFRNIQMLDSYQSGGYKNSFRCLASDCDYHWTTSFYDVAKGKGCGRCSKVRVSDSDIQNRIKSLGLRNVGLLSGYNGKVSGRQKFYCMKSECLYEWSSTLHTVYKDGTGCAKCSNSVVTEEDAQKRIDHLLKRGIKLLSKFTKVKDKHPFQCMKNSCNYEWSAVFYDVYSGYRCPKCSGRRKTDQEKRDSTALKFLHVRLNSMFHKGQTTFKIHHDKELFNELAAHWLKQFAYIPDKPEDGNWDMDHIIPVSIFNPYDVAQLKLCWHHKNIQWLDSDTNTRKSNKLIDSYFSSWHYEVLEKIGVNIQS